MLSYVVIFIKKTSSWPTGLANEISNASEIFVSKVKWQIIVWPLRAFDSKELQKNAYSKLD